MLFYRWIFILNSLIWKSVIIIYGIVKISKHTNKLLNTNAYVLQNKEN